MSISFALSARTNVSRFKDTATKGDVVRYEIDATPWAEDGGAVVSAVSTIENGSATITNETLVSGVWSADVSMLGRGMLKIGVLISTATVKKQAYIDVKIQDYQTENNGDDYGQSCC